MLSYFRLCYKIQISQKIEILNKSENYLQNMTNPNHLDHLGRQEKRLLLLVVE